MRGSASIREEDDLLMLKKIQQSSLYLASSSVGFAFRPSGPRFGGVRCESLPCQPQRGSHWSSLEQGPLARCVVRSKHLYLLLAKSALPPRFAVAHCYRASAAARRAEILPICRRLLESTILRQSRRDAPHC
jgi:hypothetical protein